MTSSPPRVTMWRKVLGTVSNMEEAIVWLSYTYLYVRIRTKPQ